MEPICQQGHVLDPGLTVCSRCNSPAMEVTSEVAEEALASQEVSAEALETLKIPKTREAPKKPKRVYKKRK